MRIAVHHHLKLDLGTGHPHSVQQLLLTPRSGATQTVLDWSIKLLGIERAARFDDCFFNLAHLVSQTKVEGKLDIEVEGIIETVDRHGVLGRVPGEPVPALFKRSTDLTPADPEFVDGLLDSRGGRIAALHALMQRLGEHPATEQPGQTQMQADGQVQSQSQGADSQTEAVPDAVVLAHRFIAGARTLGIPARYVSGYLWTGEDSTSFHAWAEAYDAALGWIGFDPSLCLCPSERHVRVATGLDALTAVPIRCFPEGGPLTVVGLSVAEAAAQ